MKLTREGTLESMEVKGTLSLTANSDGANKCKVVLASTDPSGAFTFQTHPKVQHVYRGRGDACCRSCEFDAPPSSGWHSSVGAVVLPRTAVGVRAKLVVVIISVGTFLLL